MSARSSDDTAQVDHWAREVLAIIDEAVVILDAHGRLRYLNRAAEALFGSESPLEAEWIGGDNPFECASMGRPLRDRPAEMRNGGHPKGLLLRATVALLEDGGAMLELRARPSPEKALQEAEGRLRAILDNIQDRAWLKDKEGRFLDVNRFISATRGVPREKWIGLTDYDLYPRDLAERFRADDAVVMNSRQQRTVEEKVVDIDGAERWLETIKNPVFGENGEVIGTTGTARDITQRKEAERLLRESNEELERRVAEAQESLMRKERLAVLGQLAGGVAHQIRNPLGAIVNSVALLEHMLDRDRPEVTRALSMIREEVRHADVIIAGLLDFARVRAPNRSLASLADLVERALIGQSIPDEIEIRRRFEPVSTVLVDADLIQSALSNLIRNAVEAMPKGGVLELCVRASADEAVIAVRDTGPGISPDRRPLLFEPLHSTKPTGIGLGLLTARTFVEAHGGRLGLVDIPQGACFEMRFPLKATG